MNWKELMWKDQMEKAMNVSKVLQKTDGMDKALKIVQYGIRIYLSSAGGDVLHGKELERLQKTISGSRSVMRLAKFTFYFSDLRQQWPLTSEEFVSRSISKQLLFLNTILGCLNDFCDDVEWAGTMRFVSRETRQRAARFAQILWFVTVVIDLYLAKEQLALAKKQYLAQKSTCSPEQDQHYHRQMIMSMLLLGKFSVELPQSASGVFELVANLMPKKLSLLCALSSAGLGFSRAYLQTLGK